MIANTNAFTAISNFNTGGAAAAAAAAAAVQ